MGEKMNNKFYTSIFSKSAAYLLVTLLLALTLNACGAKPMEVVPAIQDTPIVAATDVATATPEKQTYEANGMTIYLNVEFPQTPATMEVYTAHDEQLATVESVRALAKQFKMNGPIYELDMQSGIPGGMLGSEKEYLVVDGNQQLRVRSDKYFTYTPNYVSRTSNLFIPNPPDAEVAIKEFMQAYGFDSAYRIEQSDIFSYAALWLSPDGFDLRYGSMQFNGLRFYFDKNGIAQVDANLLDYDQTASMNIISAEEAFQKYLDADNPYGYFQSGGGGGFSMVGDKIIKPEDFKKWTRVRPLDESLTYNGYLSSTGKSVDGGAPFILLDGYSVVGNVSDIPENIQSTYIEARGQFHAVNGVKTFELESWKKYGGFEERISGTLRHEGDQFILDSLDGKKYLLQDVPADISLPMEYAFISGVTRGDIFDWQTIDNGGGGVGGGGGGEIGFYKINFSGTPVPFPAPTPATATPEPVLKSVEGLRGTLQVNLFPQMDGSQRVNYVFLPYDGEYSGMYLHLQGIVDDTIKNYHNRPIDIWGTVDVSNGQIMVDRYENPFPDLKFEAVNGSQKLETVEGQPVTLVTAKDGVKYIVLRTFGAPEAMQLSDPAFVPDPNSPASVPSPNADNVIYEALIVPGETLLGYPGMRVFNSAPGMVDGKPKTMSIMNVLPNILPGPPPPTSMTIEKIELAYFAPDRRYSNSQASSAPVYVQPVWRFYGHYNDGNAFEILIQALKPEYLLPEVDAATTP
jgi:hypothetical protein